jgi:hypothetical protein
MLRLWPVLAVAAALARAGTPAPPVPGAPESPPAYTDTSSAEALRNMRKIGARDPATLSEAEAVEWVRSRFAWVALLRLQGKDAEALAVFEGCRSYCGKWGPSGEWAALKKWGCAKSAEKSSRAGHQRGPKAEACR